MGTYGVNCSQTCQCQNEATCSAVDGSCNCTAGFTGEMCNEREFKDLHTHTRARAHTHTHTRRSSCNFFIALNRMSNGYIWSELFSNLSVSK